MTQQRFAKADTAAWIGMIGNGALALFKGIVGLLSNSYALIADAAHSASDFAGAVGAAIGIRAAKRASDKEPSSEQAKAKLIPPVIASAVMFFIGFQLLLTSIRTISYGALTPPAWYALVAIIVSVIVKEIMFLYKYRLSIKFTGLSMTAYASEHRSDIFCSLLALIGVGGAWIGKSFDVPALYYFDPAAGLLIAVLVLQMGYRHIREMISKTNERALREEDALDLIETVQRINGVIKVDDLRAREQGHYVIVDVKISVNPRISVFEGHDIAKRVKHLLMKRFFHVSDVCIHVNPYDPGYPYKSNNDLEQDHVPTLLQ